jgi:nickel-dependent lactate racemase
MSEERISFGEKVLHFDFPSSWEKKTLLPHPSPSTDHPNEAIAHALQKPIQSPPLHERVRPGQKVAILVSDITRLWVRTDLFLPSILQVLNRSGVKNEDILLIVATGSHRDNSQEEIRRIVGEEVSQKIRVINHHGREAEELTYLGRTPLGTEVRLNRFAVESDLTIVTGGIIFHTLSGFSGGRKGILPGISGYDTIQQNHRLSLKEGGGILETVKKGEMEKNPVSQDMLAAARMIPNTFLFNVVMNEEGKIVQAVSGDLEKAHLEGCQVVKNISSVFIKEKGEITLASPGGFPWDISLYQSIKTLANASFATREGGTIILVTECRDGVGPPDWVQWFEWGRAEMIERELRKGFTIPGFVALKTVFITNRFRVILVSRLDPESVRKVGMIPASSIDEALLLAREKMEHRTNTIFMPYGSFVLPVFTT